MRVSFGCLIPILAACSSSSAGPPAPASVTPEDGRPPVQVLDAKGCNEPSNGIPAGALCIRSLKAHVVDVKGAPIPELVTTACGDGCSFGQTDGSGVTSMAVHRYMRKPALMLHGRSRFASFYMRLPGEGDPDLGTLVLPGMPPGGIVIPVDGKAADLMAGDVTISMLAGTVVEIEEFEIADQKLNATAVPLDKAPPFVDKSLQIVALYAFAPFGTRFDKGVAVSIPNNAQLPAGASVELYIHPTNALKETYGAFGGFTKIGEGHVTANGAAIRSDEGSRIPELSWIGVRQKLD